MSKQDEEKAKEILQCFKCQYEGHICDSCEKMRIIKEMAVWKEQQMIEKALKLLEENIWKYTGLDYSELSDWFRKTMEEN